MSEMRKLLQTHRDGEIQLARCTLSEFMIERAATTVAEVRFDWKPAPDAPNDYEALCAAYRHSEKTGEPLPISSEHNDEVIYTSAEANIAFRFVHDVHHVRFDWSFRVIDELDLALWHLGELEAEGFDQSSLPWRMLHADLIGQAQLIAVSGSFPTDQRRFVGRCLIGGFERGLIDEARQVARANTAEPDDASC